MRGTREEKTKLLPRVHPLATAIEKRPSTTTSNTSPHSSSSHFASSSSQSVFITLLTLSAGIGGFLFGYDTGVISGALPFMRDDLLRDYKENRHFLNFLEEVIVSSAILGAACGAAMGGWLSDRIGRKSALLAGDGLFCTGAILMAAAPNVSFLITGQGRVVVGLGVGLASVTVPVYIAECSPVSLRASLVTVNVLMITTGQLVSYIVNYFFTYFPGTWRWMLGVAGAPALFQIVGLCLLPESPRWLFLRGNRQQAQKVLKQLIPPDEVSDAENEMKAQNVATETNLFRIAYHRPEIRLQLMTGMGLQVLQQICGINTVMYYTPTILEIAGFVDKRQALFLSILPAFVNAMGTLIGMWCIDRYGRRKLLLGSLAAVCLSLLFASSAFHLGENSSGKVIPSAEDSSLNVSCPATNCHDCLNTGLTQSSCSFCVNPMMGDQFDGVCVHAHEAAQLCPREADFSVYEAGCPSPYQSWTVSFLMLYLLSFAPGLGPVPWAINAEIYPAEIRGIAGGAAATSNWLSNFMVSQCFLTIAEAVGISGVFLLYSCCALIGICFVWSYLPETKGLTFEEIQRMYRAKVAPQVPS